MYKVMIVDDEPLFRDYLRLKMDWAALGFEVCCEARNGSEALLEAEKHRPHVALVDINMPIMDGIELASRLKARFDRIAIVFISGHNEFDYLQKAIRTGVQDYLLKPFNEEEMIATLTRIIPRLPELPRREETQAHRTEENEHDLGHIRDTIVMALRMRDSETLEEVRKAIKLLRCRAWGDEYADAMTMGFVSLALSYAGERGFSYSRVWESEGDRSPHERMKALSSWDEAEQWLLSLYRRVIQLTSDTSPTKSSLLFASAVAYIEKHYTDSELSAEQVAGGVYVDPSYLRRVFRKESGYSVMEHITHIRMKKARTLLLERNRKLADIAESVGYADPGYFSKSFKKRFGVTPSEYERIARGYL